MHPASNTFARPQNDDTALLKGTAGDDLAI